MPKLLPGEIEVLLSKLCIDLGFCLSPADQNVLLDSPPPSVPEFVSAVFRAEGLDPDTADRHLFRQVREVVQSAFTQHAESADLSRRLTRP